MAACASTIAADLPRAVVFDTRLGMCGQLKAMTPGFPGTENAW